MQSFTIMVQGISISVGILYRSSPSLSKLLTLKKM